MSFRSPISSSRAWGWHSTPRFVATAADLEGLGHGLRRPARCLGPDDEDLLVHRRVHADVGVAVEIQALEQETPSFLGEGNLHAAVLELDRAELDPLRGLLDPAGPQGDVH